MVENSCMSLNIWSRIVMYFDSGDLSSANLGELTSYCALDRELCSQVS